MTVKASTSISLAAAEGHEKIVQLLLEANQLTGPVAEKWITTIKLKQAVAEGNEMFVRELLKRGADMCITNLLGGNLLHEASEQGHIAMVSLLLGLGVDIEAT